MQIKTFHFILVILLFLTLLRCGGTNPIPNTTTTTSSTTTPTITDRAKEFLNRLGPVEKYYKFAEGYDENVPIVLLGSQGGPIKDLQWQDAPYFENYRAFFTVAHVHQAQTLRDESDELDARLIDGSRIISVETARDASLKTAAILHKVAEHFKEQGKTVYLITHSFGSFVILHTLANYGNNFDKILIKAGRINIPEVVFNAFRDECGGEFLEDGVTFQKDTCEDVREKLVTLEKFQSFRSASRLQSALGENRYQNILRNVHLNNIFYLYGSRDKAVGKLSDEEIRFLTNKGAQVERFEGGHDVQDIEVFSSPPDTKTLLNDNLNAKIHNFLNSPLPSQYRVLDMPAENSMSFFLGNSETEALYDIGIVFENHSPHQVSYKLNAAFGDGPFSLFKTNVFKDHKSKFRVQFGQITQTRDSNVFQLPKNVKKEMQKMLTKEIPRVEYSEDISLAMEKFQSQFPQETFMPQLYFDILELREYEDKLASGETLSQDEQARKTILDRVQSRFTDFFKHPNNQDKNFDVVIYVSSGISGGYANTNADTTIHPSSKVIFNPSGEFQNVVASTMGGHPDLFATTLVHELGHVFVDLFDEYYAYEVRTAQAPLIEDLTQENNNSFSNNCFLKYETQEFSSRNVTNITVTIDRVFRSIGIDQGGLFYYPQGTANVPADQVLSFVFELENILNPWSHSQKVPFYIENPTERVIEEQGFIANYNGRLYAGCNGGKSFRGTQNSIMRHYFKYNTKNWPEAWGPINTYYLERFLDNL